MKHRSSSEKDSTFALKAVASLCRFSQRPFFSSKQNTVAAEKGAVLWYLFTTGARLLLKPHSWPWAVRRALSISIPLSGRQCCAPWVLKNTSLAKELGLAQRTKSVLASGQQGWEGQSYTRVNHINSLVLASLW